MPSCSLILKGQKPLPTGYPKEVNTLGDHLRKRRIDKGLLQREVADIIGVDESTITNWERQRNTPGIRFIAKIIEFLGYDPFPKPTTFSEKLVAYRTRLGLSQAKFAKVLGVDPSTLAGWETERHQPGKRSMRLIRLLPMDQAKENNGSAKFNAERLQPENRGNNLG